MLKKRDIQILKLAVWKIKKLSIFALTAQNITSKGALTETTFSPLTTTPSSVSNPKHYIKGRPYWNIPVQALWLLHVLVQNITSKGALTETSNMTLNPFAAINEQNITSKGALTETYSTYIFLAALSPCSKHYIKGRPYWNSIGSKSFGTIFEVFKTLHQRAPLLKLWWMCVVRRDANRQLAKHYIKGRPYWNFSL